MKTQTSSLTGIAPPGAPSTDSPKSPDVPDYLQQVYWWAYLHPKGVRLFEREWLVNLILWGNFVRLRDAALDQLAPHRNGHLLQIACVYGDFTQRLLARLSGDAHLDVVDIARIQLANLRRKLPTDARLRLHLQDSSALSFPAGTYDATLLFFLLHEQPADVRRATLAEAWRVTRPGGRIVIVDYHRPDWHNPLRYLMFGVLKALEPFALDLWREEIASFLPANCRPSAIERTTCFGGLYQQVVITV